MTNVDGLFIRGNPTDQEVVAIVSAYQFLLTTFVAVPKSTSAMSWSQSARQSQSKTHLSWSQANRLRARQLSN